MEIDRSSLNRPLVQRIGKYRPLSKNKNGDISQVVGPDCWIMMIAILTILLGGIVMFIIVLSYESTIAIILWEILVLGLITGILYSFYSLVTTDPGIIPKSDVKVGTNSEGNEEHWFSIKLKDIENFSEEDQIKLKVCDTWMIIRPPRSFHCSKWNVWVEVHDHHWPWVGGWIGLRNHKKFVVFLLTTGISSFLSTVLCFPPIIQKSDLIFADGNGSQDINLILSVIFLFFTFLMGWTLCTFGIYHICMASNNITTNESLRWVYRNKANPFNKGTSENLHLFWSTYPKSESNLKENLARDHNRYYSDILERYGVLSSRRADPEDSAHAPLPEEDNPETGYVEIYKR